MEDEEALDNRSSRFETHLDDLGILQEPSPLILNVKDLHVTFGHRQDWVPAVRGVSFSVVSGETLAIIGESGSGKSVTARAVMGLLPKETTHISGSINLLDHELVGAPDKELRRHRGRDIAYVFQDATRSLNPTMKIGFQLVEAISAHSKGNRKHFSDLAIEYLERVRIPSAAQRFHQYPHELSGGMRQRVMIAMALSSRPKLIILDEPTTALDVTTQAQIMELLEDLQSEYKMAILLISHDMGIAATFSDRLAVMYAGRIVEQGATNEIFLNMKMPYTKALVESIPSLEHPPLEPLHAIEGSPPNPRMPISGCPFGPRCPHAVSQCLETAPPIDTDVHDHQWSCWFPLEVRVGD